MEPKSSRLSVFLLCILFRNTAESMCNSGCDLALASYYIWDRSNTYDNISNLMKSGVLSKPQDIITYNKDKDKDSVKFPKRVNVPFPCECLSGMFLGHTFLYQSHDVDSYKSIARLTFSNLTTADWMERVNFYPANDIPEFAKFNVTVNCSCGNREVSKDYGLFITYPLRIEDSLESIAKDTKLDAELLQRYNPGVNFSQGFGLVFIPGKVICIYVRYFREKNGEESKLPPNDSMAPSTKDVDTDTNGDNGSKYIMVDKSPEFSYEELANATDNFSLANKIGQGCFGEVYYGELRGQKIAIKKMKMQATREFLSELSFNKCSSLEPGKFSNIIKTCFVHLIGYCVQGFLFLVYEYMENGNLSQHLHNSEKEPMPLSTRIKISLDVARGLEYIHDHSVPVYIHRDIKSDNILLNENFIGKIADFGLTKLTDAASSADNTDHVAGTFGYMPPENAYGRISRKIDVYAFGVVLYELISAKAAVVKIHKTEFKSLEIKTNEYIDEYKSLVALFDEVMDQKGDPIEVYLFFHWQMAKLAKACINRDPKQRPTMRAVVVSLMTLNSTIDDGSRTGSSELSTTMEHDSN
nr:nodulation protein [Melilotus officinalis]